MPDAMPEHPRLARHGLDHVIAVEVLQRLEVVKRAARAAGTAHVDVDDREPHQVRDRADPALRPGRIGVAIAGVLDQRRIGTRAGGQVHVDRQAGPVARRQIAVAALGNGLVVHAGARRRIPVAEDRQRTRPHVAAADPIPRAGGDQAEHDAAERIGPPGGDDPAGAIDQRHGGLSRQAGGVDLLGAAMGGERRARLGAGGAERQHEQRRRDKSDPPHLRRGHYSCATAPRRGG